jgi:hypothetical protein
MRKNKDLLFDGNRIDGKNKIDYIQKSVHLNTHYYE